MLVKIDISGSKTGWNQTAILYDNKQSYILDCYGGLPNESMLSESYDKLPELDLPNEVKTEGVFYKGEYYYADWRLGEYNSWNIKPPRTSHPEGLKTYWVSWYTASDNHDFPFDYWCSGQRCSDNMSTMVSAIEAKFENDVWILISKYFPDYEERFCSESEDTLEEIYKNLEESGRFTGGERRTKISG